MRGGLTACTFEELWEMGLRRYAAILLRKGLEVMAGLTIAYSAGIAIPDSHGIDFELVIQMAKKSLSVAV